jgi:hypothetical protein
VTRRRRPAPLGAAALVVLAAALAAPAAAQARRSIPLRVQDPSALSHERRAAAAGEATGPSASQATSPSTSPSPSTPVSGGLNQQGLIASDNDAADLGSPPDTTGVISPSFYLEIVNSRVRVYSRTTLAPFGASIPLSNFVGFPGDDVFDPQIQWDPQANRWFYAALDSGDLVYGWSKGSDPSDLFNGWCRFSQAADTGTVEDYPKLGHDNSHVIIGTNVFDSTGTVFVSARVWTIAKPPAGPISSCSSATPRANPPGPLTPANSLTTHDGNSAFTPVPANTSDSSAVGWVVASDVSSGNQVQVWHVNPADGALVDDGEISVSPFAVPPPVPQPGTTDTLDSMDARLTQAVAHADPAAGGAEAVWTQHTIATSDGRSAVRWYEILPASLTLRQQGDINDAGLFAFNGAISPTSNGSDAVINYNTGNTTQLVDVRAQSRRAATPLGVMAGEAVLGQSSATDQDFTCTAPNGPPCRWGDYAGASPDPNDQSLVWGSNQLNGPLPSTSGNPVWVTRNFALVATGRPPAPSIAAPDPAGKGDQVRLDASGSTTDGPVTDYSWDLDGNGTYETDTGNSPIATVTFNRVGPASVAVRVTDDRGQVGTAGRQINVADHPPVAALRATPNPAPIPKAVTLDASGSTDRDGRIVDYAWDLDGNGTFETDSGTNPRVTHSYRTAGRVNVKVRVRDDDGSTTDATVTLINRTNLSISVKRKQRMGKGVKLKATCSVRCTAKFTLQLSKKDAKRLHLKRNVGSLKLKLSARKAKKLTVNLSKKARRRFAGHKSVKVTLIAVASDAARSPVTVKKTITLRR